MSADFDTVREALTAEHDGFCAWCQVAVHEAPHDHECEGRNALWSLDRIEAREKRLREALDGLYEAHGCRDEYGDRNPVGKHATCGECADALAALGEQP